MSCHLLKYLETGEPGSYLQGAICACVVKCAFCEGLRVQTCLATESSLCFPFLSPWSNCPCGLSWTGGRLLRTRGNTVSVRAAQFLPLNLERINELLVIIRLFSDCINYMILAVGTISRKRICKGIGIIWKSHLMLTHPRYFKAVNLRKLTLLSWKLLSS